VRDKLVFVDKLNCEPTRPFAKNSWLSALQFPSMHGHSLETAEADAVATT
jgi:hypothetical protein